MSDEIEIRLSGSGGQGLQLSAKILSRAFTDEGKNVAQSQSYEPTSRGGMSRSDLVIGSDIPDYPLASAVDYMLILDQIAIKGAAEVMRPGGTVITDVKLTPEPPRGDFKVLALPITETAIKLGNVRIANVIALGVLAGLGELCSRESLESAVGSMTPPKFRDLNMKALRTGYDMAAARL
ncbi:MAG: 2-oxoacid:acceptor oxidoreductase family protein [Magnetovibrio sp.]|nr:2-oxoacid:acceptor oxidoreductase family protein [Magnetovibrio sp.]